MIFVSSSCTKYTNIKESVEELAINGFKNIELSGGTKYYENFEEDLLELKYKYNLSYRCHNYFPPPIIPFVLNLASLDDEIFKNSYRHVQMALALSKKLGANQFGFHAGFFVDIKLNEIGKKLSIDKLFDLEKATNRFCQAYREIEKSTKNVSLYLENNVFSKTNAITYKNKNPFMMTNYNEYKTLKNKIDFNLLLDVAHLKVSTNTLNLNFEEECTKMINTLLNIFSLLFLIVLISCDKNSQSNLDLSNVTKRDQDLYKQTFNGCKIKNNYTDCNCVAKINIEHRSEIYESYIKNYESIHRPKQQIEITKRRITLSEKSKNLSDERVPS